MFFALPAYARTNTQSTVLSNKVFTLNHIPAHQAKKILTDLSIGRDINCMVDDSVILFTADNQADMDKASAILKVIDSKLKYSIMPAAVKPDQKLLPNTKDIDAAFEELAIGTFKQLPTDSKIPMAILDMHKSDLIIIAPENRVNRIRASVRRNREQKRLAKNSGQPQGVKSLPDSNISETKLDTAIKQLLAVSKNTAITRDQPELETFSKSLVQSTGPVSQPEQREMEVTITVGDKQKITRIKGDKVVEQVESNVEEAKAAKEKTEFKPLDEELFAELLKALEEESEQEQPSTDAPDEKETDKTNEKPQTETPPSTMRYWIIWYRF